MTISKTPRADLKRIVDPHARALIEGEQARTSVKLDFTDSAMQEAERIQRAMSTDMPVMPEPIERETWFSWRDWEWSDLWAVGFVGVVIAFGAHLAGVWGQ